MCIRDRAYADNRVGELSLDWDAEQVLADINAGVDLSALFRQDELDSLLAGIQSPDFQPVDVSEQPRLDQKAPITCPHCGEEFIPE